MDTSIAPLDLMWFLMETPASPTHVGALLIFEPPRGRPELVSEIAASYRAHRPTPPFNFVPDLTGHAVPRFREANFYDPAYHVSRLALPAGATYDDALRLVADLHESLLDRDRPLFRVWLIEGLPDGRFAMYTKMHHAIVDGVAAQRRIHASLSARRVRAIPPPPFAVKLPAHKPRAPQALIEKLASLGSTATKQSIALGGLSMAALRKGFLELIGAPATGSMPFTAHPGPMNEPLHAARAYATLTLLFREMRAVGRHFGATLNDVAVTIIDEAVHRYLRETGRAFPHRLVAMLPMSLREEGDADGGTKVSAMFAPLGSDEASVIERIQQVKAATASAKRELRSMSKEAAMIYAVSALGLAELAAVTHVDRLTRPLANLVISNVAGAQQAAYLGGARLVGAFPISAIAASVGLNVTFTSNHDRVDFGFVGDGITMHDLPRLAQLTREAFEALQAAADGSRQRH